MDCRILLGCVLYMILSTACSRDEDKTYWMDAAQQSLGKAIAQRHNMGVAKNVILFLGDGMGISTVTAARIYKGQKNGQSGEETQLNFEKFPNVALSKTYTVDRQVGDSSGTATAYLGGVKANMGTVGVDSRVAHGDCSNMNNTDTHVQSILVWSLAEDKSVGIVTTTRITHATPAAAYAHSPDRNWETDKDIPDSCPGVKDIAYQLLKGRSDIHVMLGGGRKKFYNRNDGRLLPEEWLSEKRAKGISAQYVQNATEFRAVCAASTDYLLGLFTESHMTFELSRDNNQEPSIVEMTQKAIEILKKNQNGFFLLVEGGRIDHGHHGNWAKRALEETVMLDDAVAVATEMTSCDDTLIVVTADHSHVFNIAGYASRGNDILGLVDKLDPGKEPTDGMPYTTLVYGNGPGPDRSQNLTGVNTNKSVGIVRTTRITHATPAAAYAHSPDRNWETDKDIPDSCPGVKDIAYQLLKGRSDIHVMLGGGRREFYNRNDGQLLPEEWLSEKRAKSISAQYVQNATEFRAVCAADTDYLLGLFAESHMTYELSRDNSHEPSIVEMTQKAIEILKKNQNGFFLLVEGGRIDHGHHDNWAKRALEEAAMFDDAVAVATEMTSCEDTLIVVTADHSHVFNIAGYASRGNDILGQVDKVDPGQEPTDGMPYTTLVYGNGPGPDRSQNLTGVNTTTDDFRYQRVVPFQPEWETHGGEDVGIYATGPITHLFHGVHEQNYIAHVMAYAFCVGPNTKHCK